jgi:streptogramin lyase
MKRMMGTVPMTWSTPSSTHTVVHSWSGLLVAGLVAVGAAVGGCGSSGGDGGDGNKLDSLAADLVAGEGAVWIHTDTGELLRLDPESEELTEIAADVPGQLAAGEGAVWLLEGATYVAGEELSRLHRVDVETGEVEVWAGDLPYNTFGLAAGFGAVWTAGESLQRIDASSKQVTTVRGPVSSVTVGEAAVWALESPAPGRMAVFKIDPGTTKVVETTEFRYDAPRYSWGDEIPSSWSIAAGAGAVWLLQSFASDALNELENIGVVYRLDPQTGEVEATAEVGLGPHQTAAGDDGVWVTNQDGDEVFRLDPQSGEVADTFEPGGVLRAPVAVAFGAAWVATGSYTGTGETNEIPGVGGGEVLEAEDAKVVRIEP